MPANKPLGRPHIGEVREGLARVTFRADKETLDALKKLTVHVSGPGVRRPKSVAIRKALIEAAKQLS
jgi:hypothetical protein